MIIDTHAHLLAVGPAIDQAELAETLRQADAAGIDRIVMLGSVMNAWAHPTLDDCKAVNDQTIAAVNQHPDRFAGAAYVNPRHGQAARDEIRRCVADGPLCGVKLWVSAPADHPTVDIVAETVIELDVPILQHAWNVTGGNGPDHSTAQQVAVLAKRFPDAKIQIAHAGGIGWEGIDAIADCPNVWLDTSGAQPMAGVIEYAVDRLGPQRVVFATDYPIREFSVKLAQVRTAIPDPTAREAVLAGNALTLWNLPGDATA